MVPAKQFEFVGSGGTEQSSQRVRKSAIQTSPGRFCEHVGKCRFETSVPDETGHSVQREVEGGSAIMCGAPTAARDLHEAR